MAEWLKHQFAKLAIYDHVGSNPISSAQKFLFSGGYNSVGRVASCGFASHGFNPHYSPFIFYSLFRLEVRTSPFHGEDTSSILVTDNKGGVV